MKFWKKALIISSLAVVLFGIGYFINHAKQMTVKVDFNSIVNKSFLSSNKEFELSVYEDRSIRFISKDDYFTNNEISYENNFLSFVNEDKIYDFYFFNSSSVFFQNDRTYLYFSEVT